MAGSNRVPKPFAVIFVLGAPGAGKGTLCTQLAEQHAFSHFSVGDNLRSWMRAHSHSPLASRIQEKLDHQGFLDSTELNPFIGEGMKTAIEHGKAGIMIDGFPRCAEQLESWNEWPYQDDASLQLSKESRPDCKPDAVLLFHVTRDNARTRYVARARDKNDSVDKFERRFTEYEREGPLVELAYRERGLLIDIDADGTKEQNADTMKEALDASQVWKKAINENGKAESYLLI